MGAADLTSLGAGLVGRDAELGVIDRLLDRVRGGQSESLGVRGEAGIGKTALLDYARGADSESTPATRRMVMSPGRDPVPDTIALTPRLLALFRERIERLPAAT